MSLARKVVPIPKPTQPMAVGIGSVVGAYRLLERLGAGGMGEVFLASHEQLERRVALKLLHSERSGDAHHVERFVREAWLANRVRHENVVDVTDLAFLPDGRPYVVMEYIDGGTLYTMWDEPAGLDVVGFLDAMVQVADALAAAHRASVVHRDVKPANIFLTEHSGRKNHVKIADFGLSKLMSATDDGFTQSGIVLATPPYMSPEQATGEPIDGRSDLYSLGITMWEMLVGHRPFKCNAFGEYVLAHATRAIAPPSQAGESMVPGGIPPELDDVVMRCLAKRREERYASAEEVRAALEQLRDTIAAVGSRTRDRARRTQRLLRLGVVAAGVISLVATGLLLTRRSAPAAAQAAETVRVPVLIPVDAPAQQPQFPPLVIQPPHPAKMQGLGLTISKPAAAPKKHRDPIDPKALKDPFAE